MVTIKLPNGFTEEHHKWLLQNVGPRMHFLHNSMGGEGWIVKRNYKNKTWQLTLEDDKKASMFILTYL
jgi:hypothetical protein